MDESQNFGHEHPLVLLNEEHSIRNGSEVECCRCEEKVSAPCFGCLESCGFYLHKLCAEAPLEINHRFHRDHPLLLLNKAPYPAGCNFCDEPCEKFVYHCSCQLDLHIKCALFTYNIAEKNLKEFEHVDLQDPFISTDDDGEEVKDIVGKCFVCWESLSNYTYISLDHGFNIHKKCVELPFKLDHLFHRRHTLVLQFNAEQLSCKICQETSRSGFVYCCSLCKFVVHIECVSLSPIFEDKSHHPHPFTLVWRPSSFFCDMCGIEGHHAAYICSTCNIIVHKNCISIPLTIKSIWHEKHRVFHKLFIHEDYLKSRICIMCHKDVNTEHGSYYCGDCDVVLHVKCATKEKHWYVIVSLENENDSLADINSLTIIDSDDAGRATIINHFKHMHNLMLSDEVVGFDKCCDGCMLPILNSSFYYCSEYCDFFLHKACTELPKKKLYWDHRCRNYLNLISGNIFVCSICWNLSNGFAYKCCNCWDYVCLRCITLSPGAVKCLKHEHPLLYYIEFDEALECNPCGLPIGRGFRCKDCNFTLCRDCYMLPTIVRHKCDEHVLTLTYHEDNDYSESHYCDICEEKREPKDWFYHCATCDTSAHKDCILDYYQFVKPGSIYQKEEVHPHPLTFVKKIYYYPDCKECGEPCQNLSLECATAGCNYIVHYRCIKTPWFWWE